MYEARVGGDAVRQHFLLRFRAAVEIPRLGVHVHQYAPAVRRHAVALLPHHLQRAAGFDRGAAAREQRRVRVFAQGGQRHLHILQNVLQGGNQAHGVLTGPILVTVGAQRHGNHFVRRQIDGGDERCHFAAALQLQLLLILAVIVHVIRHGVKVLAVLVAEKGWFGCVRRLRRVAH